MRPVRRASSSSIMVRKVDEYYIEDLINKGDFSNVYSGFHSITKQQIAMKIISKKKMSQIENGDDIVFAETKIFPYLQHPNVARQLKCFENTNSYFQVMEFYHTDLLTYLQTKNPNYTKKLQILDQILSAIEYIHVHNICHRDIKLDNILLTEDDDAILSDFGFATFADKPITGFLGSCGYCAPEVLKKDNIYDGIQADLWSTGILIYALFAERMPFEHTKDPLKMNPSFIDYSKVNPHIKRIVSQLLVVDPKLRSSITEIRHDKVFNQVQDRVFNHFDLSDYSNPSTLRVVSEIFDDPEVEEHIEQQSGLTPEKIMYNIINAQLPEVFNTFYVSLSCPLPKLDETYDQTSFFEENYEIESDYSSSIQFIRQFFISRKFTVSIPKNGQIIAIRNMVEQDITLTIELLSGDSENSGLSNIRIFGNDEEGIKALGSAITEAEKY